MGRGAARRSQTPLEAAVCRSTNFTFEIELKPNLPFFCFKCRFFFFFSLLKDVTPVSLLLNTFHWTHLKRWRLTRLCACVVFGCVVYNLNGAIKNVATKRHFLRISRLVGRENKMRKKKKKDASTSVLVSSLLISAIKPTRTANEIREAVTPSRRE